MYLHEPFELRRGGRVQIAPQHDGQYVTVNQGRFKERSGTHLALASRKTIGRFSAPSLRRTSNLIAMVRQSFARWLLSWQGVEAESRSELPHFIQPFELAMGPSAGPPIRRPINDDFQGGQLMALRDSQRDPNLKPILRINGSPGGIERPAV